TANSAALCADPPAVVTVIFPLLAPLGTIAMSWVADALLTAAASAANETRSPDESGSKFWPMMITAVPEPPRSGTKLMIIGGAKYAKLFFFVAVPAEVVTLTSASPAVPPGVVAVRDVEPFTTTLGAATFPIATAVSPATKFVPMIAIASPPATLPFCGATVEIVGG